jgi:holin-like protein
MVATPLSSVVNWISERVSIVGSGVCRWKGGDDRHYTDVSMSLFLQGATWLLLFQCIGEGVTRLFGWPIPGPVVGLAVLFLALQFRTVVPESLNAASDGLAGHLSLLFVPAGVGVMLHFGRLADEWVPIAAALLVSAVLTVAAVSVTFSALARWQHVDEGDAPDWP